MPGGKLYNHLCYAVISEISRVFKDLHSLSVHGLRKYF